MFGAILLVRQYLQYVPPGIRDLLMWCVSDPSAHGPAVWVLGLGRVVLVETAQAPRFCERGSTMLLKLFGVLSQQRSKRHSDYISCWPALCSQPKSLVRFFGEGGEETGTSSLLRLSLHDSLRRSVMSKVTNCSANSVLPLEVDRNGSVTKRRSKRDAVRICNRKLSSLRVNCGPSSPRA